MRQSPIPILLSVLCSCVGTSDSLGVANSPVIGGEPAEVADWPGIVGVVFGAVEAGDVGCTGTVIAPRAVLTAAHCIGEGADRPTAIRLGTNDLSDRAAQTIAVGDVAAMSDGFTGFDIGVLILAEDAPVAPVPLATECGAAVEGSPVTLTAYGVTDSDTFGVLYTKELTAAILACNDENLGCPASDGSYLVASPAGMCGGDSGGPLLVVNNNGKFVAGVVSGPAITESSDMCDDWNQGLYPRPDTVKAWLEDKVGAPLVQPSCDGSEPDPGNPDPGNPDPGTADPSGDGDSENDGGCYAAGAKGVTGQAAGALLMLLLLAGLTRTRRPSQERTRAPRL